MKKHILVISQYFYPETFRINDISQEWVKRGYKVTVITGIPNYPEGKFYEGYSYRRKRIEKWKGITIYRLPLIPRGSNSIGLIFNYMSFVFSGFLWKCFTKIKADYVFTFEVSPMTQALLGVWYAKKHNVPNYLYVQDLWPENVETVTGIHSPLVLKPIDKMVDYIYKNCTHIFTTSPSFVSAICNRKVSVPESKVHFWPQYAEEFYEKIEKSTVAEIPNNSCFKVIFTGNIGYAQGLDILPKTAECLRELDVLFCIVGEGRYLDGFKGEVYKRNLEDKFVFIPRQPAENIPAFLAACDVAFLSFMDTKLFEMTIPAKLQSYMACGIPIVASASGETETIIKSANCGVCTSIGDVNALAEAIQEMERDRTLLEEMGNKAKLYFEAHYNKKKLLDWFELYLK